MCSFDRMRMNFQIEKKKFKRISAQSDWEWHISANSLALPSFVFGWMCAFSIRSTIYLHSNSKHRTRTDLIRISPTIGIFSRAQQRQHRPACANTRNALLFIAFSPKLFTKSSSPIEIVLTRSRCVLHVHVHCTWLMLRNGNWIYQESVPNLACMTYLDLIATFAMCIDNWIGIAAREPSDWVNEWANERMSKQSIEFTSANHEKKKREHSRDIGRQRVWPFNCYHWVKNI